MKVGEVTRARLSERKTTLHRNSRRGSSRTMENNQISYKKWTMKRLRSDSAKRCQK
jgi:hypothetical protein